MAACSDYEGLIAAAVYDVVEPAEARPLKQHLGACETCRRELDELRRAARMVGSGSGELDPQARREALQGIARRVKTAPTSRFRRAPARAAWPGRAALAAGFLAAFVGIVLIARLTTPTPSKEVAVEPTPPEETRPPAPAPLPKPVVPVPAPLPEPREPKLAPPPTPEPKPAPAPPAPPPPEPPKPEKPAPTPDATPPRERVTVSVMARLDRAQGNVSVAGAPAKAGQDL